MNRFISYLCVVIVLIQLWTPIVASAQESPPTQGSANKEVVTIGEAVSPEPVIEAPQPSVAEIIANTPNHESSPIEYVQDISAALTNQTVADPLNVGDILISKVQIGDSTSTRNEFVELYNQSSHAVSLAGWRLEFLTEKHNGTDAPTRILKTFTNEVIEPGEYYVTGHSGYLAVPTIDAAFDVNVAAGSLPLNGSIRLKSGSADTVDLVGWASAVNYEGSPATAAPHRSIDRCIDQLGVMIDTNNNKNDFQVYDYSGPLLRTSPACPVVNDADVYVNFCPGIVISEIHANTSTNQFVELLNVSTQPTDLTGCMLQTNRSTTSRYVFAEKILGAGEYVAVYINDTPLTLTKTTAGTVYVLSSDGQHDLDVQQYANLAVDTSWSRFADGWAQTYSVTPGEQNVLQQYQACATGYQRNLDTGRCNKITEASTVADCGEGKYRSEETGRCRQIPAESVLAACKLGQYRSEETNRCRNLVTASTLKPCRDDQYRSEETNRCRNLATAANQLVPCKENQERNPDTNRCRNVAKAVPAAAFAVTPVADSAKVFVGWWALGGIVLFALGYAGWEWRQEVRQFARAVFSFVLRRK